MTAVPRSEAGENGVTSFIVARRVRTLFEVTTATRSFSTGLCAKQVYSKGKNPNEKTPLGELKTVDETDDVSPGVQQEDISNLLDNLNFRFNETCALSAEQTDDKQAAESGSKAKRHSSETKNSEKITGTKASKGNINRWRVGSKLTEQTEEGLANRDFLSTLQGHLQKESIASLKERLADRKVKDDTKASDGARPKGEHKKKPRKKKDHTSAETDPFDDLERSETSVTAQKVKSKLASVQRFKGAT